MKKFLCSVMVLALMLNLMLTSLVVFANEDKVEISFCVGDDTLMINGESVKVEKPYVVGEGVTLVPLRVITEAFGAKVEWVESSQTVNLSYPDVKISLQIGNPVADVNQKAETLLSAPELTESGYTMVPLRFISENFGADVSYDEATERITVIKESNEKGKEMVVGAIDASKIGDSYYKWSIENPSEMEMTDRSFDGMFTAFAYDENNYFNINVGVVDDDFDFERSFVNWKNDLKGLTLVKADKDVSNPNKKVMHLQAKDKTVFLDVWQYVTDKYIYLLLGEFENEKTEMRNEGVRLMETFNCSFSQNDTYDLSSVKDGVRVFKADSVGFSIDIPQEFFLLSSEEVENEFAFYKLDANDDVSCINIGIYSKSALGSAKIMAEEDYSNNKEKINKKVAVFSDGLIEKDYTNFTAVEYTYDIDAVTAKEHSRDVFFELGEYVYNVSVSVKMPDKSADSKIDDIINSIKIEKIDASKVGILMRNISDDEGTFVSKAGRWSLAVPNSYEEVNIAADGVVLQSMNNGTLFVLQLSNSNGANFSKVSSLMKEFENSMRKQSGVEIIKSVNTMIGNIKYADVTFSQKNEDELIYIRQLAGVSNGNLIVFTISYAELGYSEKNILDTERMIESFKIK